MLQPRLNGCVASMGNERNFFAYASFLCLVILSSALVTCQDANDHAEIRIKREGVPENRDLTVLLLNDKKRNDYNTKLGRYHSVKPLIGLLTSTARTFIQDGVTTEFATQIVGTTLDNGRIYAQLLTKTSLIFYNKPTDDDVYVKPTRIPSIFDEQWNVKEDLGFIDPDKFAVKNTDYLSPSKMDIVFASKVWHDKNYYINSIQNQVYDEKISSIPETVDKSKNNEASDYLDGPLLDIRKTNEIIINPTLSKNQEKYIRQSKAFDYYSVPNIAEFGENGESVTESNIVKVKNNFDLPTFTIKNEFSPIFYYIDNVESQRPHQQTEQTKVPKKLFGKSGEPKPKKTFTYAGFADFTTVVGDSVIIFTPNTETSQTQNPSEINVLPSAKRVTNLASKITFLSADIPVATSTFKPHDLDLVTKNDFLNYEKNTDESTLKENEENLKKVHYHVDNLLPEKINIQNKDKINLNIDIIQPSEPAFSTLEQSNTYTSVILSVENYNEQATEPLMSFKPTTLIQDRIKESVVTENIITDFTKFEDDHKEHYDQVTTSEYEEKSKKITTEMDDEILSTTESGHSDEYSEEIETTTENKHDFLDETCTSGVETRSAITTEYKTLTYLTTNFILLDSTETSTSINSNVVVETNIGFITNYLCKTDATILPTIVASFEVPPSKQNNQEDLIMHSDKTQFQSSSSTTNSTSSSSTSKLLSPSNKSDNKHVEISSTSNNISENVNHITPETKDLRKPLITTISNETNDTVTKSFKVENHTEIKDAEGTRKQFINFTEAGIKNNSEFEISTAPTTEQIYSTDDSNENEIDVIYKTLYTTYTYFTTFFGDQTSSIASHKSIETNIITSTIDLSSLNPSLFDALNENDIAPTNVRAEQSTQAFAQNSISNLINNKFLIESVEQDENYSLFTPNAPAKEDPTAIKPDGVKTYYTTYTFFTTIYVGQDANVCSRSEIYTNYIGPEDIIPTKVNPLAQQNTRAHYDFRNCKQVKLNSQIEEKSKPEMNQDNQENKNFAQSELLEREMLFSVDSNPIISENAYVTDVVSSYSKGNKHLLDSNNMLEDQISSESNIEEILPSPTLLLQTSYTTFTYFTTMYFSKDSSKVKSRLETVTNVVTETITPNKGPVDEQTLPITYYTTFTYWTTLSKDNSTTITSREEIVSNIVTPGVQIEPTLSVIDTSPIDIENIVPPVVLTIPTVVQIDPISLNISSVSQEKYLDVNVKPSIINDSLEHDDGKATFYTTYTYFTTFYIGNTSQIRSSLETITNIADNTYLVEENQLARKVQNVAASSNLLEFDNKKPAISVSTVKEEIKATNLPHVEFNTQTVLSGTYIDNLYTDIKTEKEPVVDPKKKIIFSQVAVIPGNSTIITTKEDTTDPSPIGTTTVGTTSANTPEIIRSSELETSTEIKFEEEDSSNIRKKGRLTYTSKKATFTPVITPFLSRNRPTFIPKRVPSLSSATTITRADSTPTITATPTLKTLSKSSGYNSIRKLQQSGLSSSGRKFAGRASTNFISSNIPATSRFGTLSTRGIQPSLRPRTGFKASSSSKGVNLEISSRSSLPRIIRPTASIRLRGGRQSVTVTSQPLVDEQESETIQTLQEETQTEAFEEVTDIPVKTTTNSLLRFRRPLILRQSGTLVPSRATTAAPKRFTTLKNRLTTTTRRITTRSVNPLLASRRERPNSLFPKRNLLKQPDSTTEDVRENENAQQEEDNEEILEGEDANEDNDYDSSDRKEQQLPTPTPSVNKIPNKIQIRPFKRRSKRQIDYGTRKFTNFRRPGTIGGRRTESDTEADVEKSSLSVTIVPTVTPKGRSRFNSRSSNITSKTTSTTPALKVSSRQSFIVRGESRTTTTIPTPSYKRNKSRVSTPRSSSLNLAKPKSIRINSSTRPGTSRSTNSRSRTRTTTGRSSNRQRNSFENTSNERLSQSFDDGKYTVTHQIPVTITVPVVNGKVTEYKNLLSASPKIETLQRNQVSTTIGPLGNQQLVLAMDSTEIADNGATKVVKYLLHQTPTSTIVFTPTTIRGRKTSYSHILPSTVYNVEAVTSTIAPEINANLPLANLLLSQLLLGNQQPGINPLLALQGPQLLQQQPVVQTPVTEYKTKTTTYVTTITDARETVLPITFRGQRILTTIVDPTTNVITATEFITDTVVTTPTVLAPAPQFNSLLLPLLLQQQQQQQSILSLQTANPLIGLGQGEFNLDNNVLGDVYSNSLKSNILAELNSNENYGDDGSEETEEEDPPLPPPPPSTPNPMTHAHFRVRERGKAKASKFQATIQASPPIPSKITSVVTLYVSGRYPGEFSTVLSTVISEDTQTVRKREAIYFENIKVFSSVLPVAYDIGGTETDINNLLLLNSEKYWDESPEANTIRTESLESIIGDLNKHIKLNHVSTKVVKLAVPSSISNLNQSLVDDGS